MGVSTNAILFYGYHLEDGTEIPEEALELYGDDELVLVGQHCSDDYPMHYIYWQASEITARRGYPKSAVTALADDPLHVINVLRAFAEKYNLPLPGQDGASEVGWWLVSWWG